MADHDKELAKRDSNSDASEVKLGTDDVSPTASALTPGHDHDGGAKIELENNESGEVKNPLHGIPRSKLLADVEAFAQEKGMMEHIDILKRGALVAQNPLGYDGIDDLSAEEKAALHHEILHKWSHPLMLYITIFVCSIGAAVQGWDQTGSNGATLAFTTALNIPTGCNPDLPNYSPDCRRNLLLEGAINSAPYIGAALIGTWCSDPLNRYLGRRGCIFVAACILTITPICSGFVQQWYELFIVRILLGIGMGAKGSTVPVFAAENAPARIRGALVMGWQLWTAFGIFLGFAANVVVRDTGAISWRLQLGSAFIPAFPLACLIFFCPESPRWLIGKNRYPQAFKSLLRLRHQPVQAARDLYTIHVLLKQEEAAGVIRGESYFKRFAELFTIPRVRRATLASGVVMLAQQMCGINIIAFYSSSVFLEATGSVPISLYASLGFGALNFVGAFPALFTIDTFGRRSLLLVTFPIMAVFLLATGLSFLMPTNPDGTSGPGRLGAIALFIYLFALAYSVGEGPVPFAYSAEVFPLKNREVGMAWAVTVCLGFAAVLSITFPLMKEALTVVGAFGFYAGLNILAWILIFFFLPETKQLTLEQLDQVFSVPTEKFASYQLNKALPYFIKRYILLQKNARLEPLITVDDLLLAKAQKSQA